MKEPGPSAIYKHEAQPKQALPLPPLGVTVWAVRLGLNGISLRLALHTWQSKILWVQSCLVRKRTARILSGHFHPVILYKETSHSSVFNITGPTQGGGVRGQALWPLWRDTHFSVSQAPLPQTEPCHHQMAAQTSAGSCRLTALTGNSWERTLHSFLCTNTGGSVHPPAAEWIEEFLLSKITTIRPFPSSQPPQPPPPRISFQSVTPPCQQMAHCWTLQVYALSILVEMCVNTSGVIRNNPIQ